MARQDHIRHHVAKVRTEARSLIQRYRDERIEKARARASSRDQLPEDAAASIEESVSEAISTLTGFAVDPASLIEASGYLASPDIERFVRDAAARHSPQRPAPASKPEAEQGPTGADGGAPPAAAESSPVGGVSMPQVGQAFLAALKDPSQLLGLEPLLVAPRRAAPRARHNTATPQQSHAAPPAAPEAAPSVAAAQNFVVLSTAQASALGLTPLIVTPAARPDRKTEADAREPASRPAPAARPRSEGIPISILASVGPGLTLKFGELGITTLEDLAGADEQQLRQKLGPIGALIQLDTWIAQARNLVAAGRRT